MIINDAGHSYTLDCLDEYYYHQHLQFVKRVGDKYPGNAFSSAGTTSQEVLRALIDRAYYVNNQLPSWYTRLGAILMKLTIWLFECRAAKIHGRGIPDMNEAVYGATCWKCGHVGHVCNKKEESND